MVYVFPFAGSDSAKGNDRKRLPHHFAFAPRKQTRKLKATRHESGSSEATHQLTSSYFLAHKQTARSRSSSVCVSSLSWRQRDVRYFYIVGKGEAARLPPPLSFLFVSSGHHKQFVLGEASKRPFDRLVAASLRVTRRASETSSRVGFTSSKEKSLARDSARKRRRYGRRAQGPTSQASTWRCAHGPSCIRRVMPTARALDTRSRVTVRRICKILAFEGVICERAGAHFAFELLLWQMVVCTSLGALIADAASRICSSLTLVRKNNTCGLSESIVPNVKLTCVSGIRNELVVTGANTWSSSSTTIWRAWRGG